MRHFIFVAVLVLLASTLAAEGIPKLISYQGRITDATGEPVPDGEHTIAVGIYHDSLATAPIWSSGPRSVTTNEGLFSCILGENTPLPDDIATLSSTGPDLWLGVTVDSATSQLWPRTRFTAVPFAFHALRADSAATADGVTPNSITSQHIIDGAVALADLADDMATEGNIIKFTGGAWSLADDDTGSGGGISYWTLDNDILATDGYWGLMRGSTESAMLGDNAESHVNLGVACTTGVAQQNDLYSTVGGGRWNTAGPYSVCAGGTRNKASAPFATIGGGDSNVVVGTLGGVCSGCMNQATGDYAVVGGGRSNEANDYWSTVAGGMNNNAELDYSAVCGGSSNSASGVLSFVGGGGYNEAAGLQSVISGGYYCQATGQGSFVGGGQSNMAEGDSSVVCGGMRNRAVGNCSFVGGGSGNYAAGKYSCILGNWADTITAAAEHSMTFGDRVYLNQPYRIAFFQGPIPGFMGINRDNHGGTTIDYPLHVGTNTGNGNGAHLTPGGTWTNGSSRQFKEDLESIDGATLLEKIRLIATPRWRYKNTDEYHIGPMAEDFVNAFDVGTVREDGSREDNYLAASDVAGVALAAVKELHRTQQELVRKTERIEQLEERLARLEHLMGERVNADNGPAKTQSSTTLATAR